MGHVLHAGSRVPGRKPVNNPHTVSGRPQWNTYASLDYIAATTELRRMMGGVSKGVARHHRRLHEDNLCHRIKPGDVLRADYENQEARARILSLRMDRLEGIKLDLALAEWGRIIRHLIDNGQRARLKRLRDLERARGQVRVKNALKFANVTV